MCTSCGCDASGHAPSPHSHDGAHGHEHGHEHGHQHGHGLGAGAARLIRIERDLLEENSRIAALNRRLFAARGVLALNLVSSPGAGKTSWLVSVLETLRARMPLAVIEGDQATDRDAARVRATGIPALQINTGKGCHLDAPMIARALEELPLPTQGALFIENVGNLVCPAGFDLGEAHKIVFASVTEGEDKPLKYPGMFAVASLMLVSKCDLLAHLRFDVGQLIDNARRVNPRIEVLRISAETGLGLAEFGAWIASARGALQPVAAAEHRHEHTRQHE